VRLITLFGAVSTPRVAVLIGCLTTWSGRGALIFACGSGIIVSFVGQVVERGRGVDTPLITKEVPPE